MISFNGSSSPPSGELSQLFALLTNPAASTAKISEFEARENAAKAAEAQAVAKLKELEGLQECHDKLAAKASSLEAREAQVARDVQRIAEKHKALSAIYGWADRHADLLADRSIEELAERLPQHEQAAHPP